MSKRVFKAQMLRDLRNSRNMTMNDLSVRLKASGPSAIGVWERGAVEPNGAFLAGLCEVFGLQAADWYEYVEEASE